MVMLIACGSAEPSAQRNVPLESMLVDRPGLPSSWTTIDNVDTPGVKEGPARKDLDWLVLREAWRPEDVGRFCSGSAAVVMRMWGVGRAKPIPPLPQAFHWVCRVDDAESAADAYEDLGTQGFLGSNHPNFDFDAPTEEIYPSEWDDAGLTADEAEIACATGDARDLCATWLYRARYGQYITGFLFQGISTGQIRLAEFLPAVEAVDSAFTQLLSN